MSVSLDFFKYQYLIAPIPICLANIFNSTSSKSSLFVRIKSFALDSASSNRSASFIIFHFLLEKAPSFPLINPL
jgi:hypothetical protein